VRYIFKVLEEFPMQRKHFMAEAAKRLENMRDEDIDESIGKHTSAMSIRKWYKKRTSVMHRGKNSRMSKGLKRSIMSQR